MKKPPRALGLRRLSLARPEGQAVYSGKNA